jgi:hypothetical protein
MQWLHFNREMFSKWKGKTNWVEKLDSDESKTGSDWKYWNWESEGEEESLGEDIKG